MDKSTIYNKLSDAYDAMYLDNIRDFIANYKKTYPTEEHEYCHFYPSFGITADKPCEFLILGQAVNGWSSKFNTHKPVSEEYLSNALEESNCYYSNDCPLDWVNVQWSNETLQKKLTEDDNSKQFYSSEYKSNSSFFWNVTYKVISDYLKFSRDEYKWARNLVWSNLYKIAPNKANPDNEEQSFQSDQSVQLIKQELDELQPKVCIVMTNDSWWESFRTELKTSVHQHQLNPSVIESVESYRNTKIIVTTRPFSGNSDLHAKEIIAAINTPI